MSLSPRDVIVAYKGFLQIAAHMEGEERGITGGVRCPKCGKYGLITNKKLF